MADSEVSFDALLPPQMASRAEAIGIRKAQTDFWTMLALAVLAGAFIAAGAVYSTTVLAGAAALPYGVGACWQASPSVWV
jgi:formate transporter